MVGLSETSINNSEKILKFRQKLKSTSVITEDNPDIVDLSYNPDCTVKTIKQHHRRLTQAEIQTISMKYQYGVSSTELARQFGCGPHTIIEALKKNGIRVSHKALDKPYLVRAITELYKDLKTPKEIGKIVGIDCATVRQVLKAKGFYIRKSWEYPKNRP